MKTLLPKLRFPDFQDEWEEKHLIDVADKKVKWSFIGGPFGSNLKASDYTANGIRIIQLQNIGDGEFIDDYKIFTSEQKADELLSCNIYPGDIILSKMGDPVARACLIPDKHQRYVMCSDGIRLVVDKKKYDKLFIYSYINSADFRTNAEKAATGSTRKRIGLDNLKDLPVFVPEFAEQQKIAGCLISLDELITAQSQKVEALQVYKKGLMQNLFPAEGESVPRLRFPEFESAGEWEEKRFGDILQINSGQGFKASEYSNSGIRLLQIENVGYGKVKWSENTIYLPKDYVQKYPDLVLRQGDIVLALNRPVTNNELKIARLRKHDEPSLLYQRVGKVEKISDSITQNFIIHLCQKIVKNFVIKQSIGSDQPFISLKGLYAQTLFIPTPREQQKIAELLTTIDEQISAQRETVEMLKSHKKGLMQGLFPGNQTSEVLETSEV